MSSKIVMDDGVDNKIERTEEKSLLTRMFGKMEENLETDKKQQQQQTKSSRKNSTEMAIAAAQGKLIAVIGDEDTCVGFLLGGIGEINKKREPNFLVVDKNTSVQEIEEVYKKFMKREDIDIILINQNIAEQIRHVIDTDNDNPLPAVLEIPSKDHPYDPTKDSVLRRAKGLYSAEDMR
ncbi:V-type proton ATPase subunit F [Halocaridina rubra]|uniref:V-type proton ATPase subunit F n=1 Tax=Halocaridina rubra TaxID=373956 RepID=A0AAN8XHB0_HALRR